MTTKDPGGIVRFEPGKLNDIQEPSPPPEPGQLIYVAGDPQGQWMGEWSDKPDGMHTTFLQIASACAGMHADAKNDRTGYAVLIAPGESHQLTKDMCKMSGCALAVRAWLRLFGLVHVRLAPPYVVTRAFDDVYTIAEQRGKIGRRPNPQSRGIIVAMGRGNRAHMCVLAHVDADGYAWTIDGGQVNDQGEQCITWRQRKAHLNSAGLIYALDDREIIWTLDPAELCLVIRLQWRLPWLFGSTPAVSPFELAAAHRARIAGK